MIQNNSLSKELLVNSYEARLLFSGYNLFELKKIVSELDIEKDLFLIYEFLKSSKNKTFNNAILFFYKWLHEVNLINIKLLQFRYKYEFVLMFLILHKNLVIFLELFEQSHKNLNQELKNHFNDFKTKYSFMYEICSIYNDIIEKIYSLKNNQNEYFELFELVDNKIFLDYLHEAKSIFNGNFGDKYGIVKQNILDAKIDDLNTNIITRDYLMQNSDVYKIILSKIDILKQSFVYSNINLIHAHELNNNQNLFKMLFCLDKFILCYCINKEKTQNYLYFINKCEKNDTYETYLNKYFTDNFQKASQIINKELTQILEKVPKIDVFDFINIFQNKIYYHTKAFFYSSNKDLLRKINSKKTYNLDDFKILFDNVFDLTKNFFISKCQNAKNIN